MHKGWEEELLSAIKKQPVVYTADLADKYDVSQKVVLHCLNILKKNHNINFKLGRRMPFHVINKAVRKLGYRDAEEYFVKNGLRSFKQMAEDLGVSYQTASRHYHLIVKEVYNV